MITPRPRTEETLHQSLEEERRTHQKLTELVKSRINAQAASK